MIVAVFCIAVAMIAGGAWAVFTGWELIIIERGWTQVLLGGMLITGGLLLGGIGVLATHVKRLASKLDELPGSRARDALTPSLVAEVGPDRRDATAQPAPRQGTQPVAQPLADAPRTPPAPPRPESRVEPRSEPGVEPVADIVPESAERPAGPAISAPAAIALGAAAGAGTAAIASSLLSSGAQPRPGEEFAERDAEAEDDLADEVLTGGEPGEEPLEQPDPLRSFENLQEAERTPAIDDEIPTPDGEDGGMFRAAEGDEEEAEDLESEALEAEGAKAEALRGADGGVAGQVPAETAAEVERDTLEREIFERVIPPGEEPDAAQVALPEPEARSESELEEFTAVDVDETQEPAWRDPPSWRDAEMKPVRDEAAVDLAESQTGPGAEMQAEAPPEPSESQDGQAEEPAERQPAQQERSLVGTYESGGNVYTMYSDGSIDAQTPNGNFQFASLDELKSFIAEGGEDQLS